MEVDFHLPPKDENVVPLRGAGEATCLANLFRMELNADVTIYKYRVDISKTTKDKEIDITKGIKSEYNYSFRICVMDNF